MNVFFAHILFILFLTISCSSALPSWGGGDGGNGNNGNDYFPWQKTTKSPSEKAKCGTNILGEISLDFNGTREALVGEIPWQVSVHIKKVGAVWSHGCGGVVIAKDHVLTSAKCVSGSGIYSGMTRVEAGSIDLSKGGFVRRRRQAPAYPGQDTPGLKYVQRTFVHPDYDKTTQANDIAILRLATPFGIDKASGKINEICLPKTKSIIVDETLLLAGWGSNKVNATLSPKLRVVKVEKTNCTDAKLSCFMENLVDVQDDCEGDFGGAIFSYDQESKTSSLAGIYSRGEDCSQDNPAVFIPVQPYIEWIKKNSENAYGGGSSGSG